MAEPVDIDALLAPISDEDPCGPDLEAAGDADFMNFMADFEGRLPAAYFSFDPRTIDFKAAFAGGDKFLEETRDVRLVVLLAKLSLLNRDLAGFAAWLDGLKSLLVDRWDHVNPKGEGDDFLSRMAPLYTLDDVPVVILPLQHVTLAETARDGRVTYRSQLIASGEARAREGEQSPDAAAIEKAFLNVDLDELTKTHQCLVTIKTALADIRNVATTRAGFAQAVKLETLPPLVDKMAAFLQAVLVRRNPDAVVEAEASPDTPHDEARAPAKEGEITSRADADAMLGAALDYFARNEPSSPAVLLIGQARHLLGKNIFEVMQALVPSYADSARVHIGGDPAFMVQVSAVPSVDTSEGESSLAEAPTAPNRQTALALLTAVATYCRTTEPSSPIPLLLDRARTLSARDFLGLLKELFSEDILSSMR